MTQKGRTGIPGGHTASVIRYGDHHIPHIFTQGQTDMAALGSIFDGVIHQYPNGALQFFRVAVVFDA